MTSYDRYRAEVKKSAERFFRETRDHKLEIRHNDGFNRHIRMKSPHNSTYWYDLITWPGNLVIRGDYGKSYVFSRATDMFEFFAHGLYKDGSMHINPQYWAEKLSSHDVSQKFDEEVFKEDFREQAGHLIENETIEPEQKDRFLAEIEDFFENEDYCTASTAINAVESFEFWNNEAHEHLCEYRKEAIRFDDAYEWISDCTAYERDYLWACHAILLGIKHYYAVFGRPTVSVNDVNDTQDVARRGVPVG